MAMVGLMEDALKTRRVSSKDFLMRSDLLHSKAPQGSYLPNFKLIEQGPHADLHAHFHNVNQFQVVVSGSGLFDAKKVFPTTVHYVNAYTPYGPIIGGDDGIHYLVIRDHIDQGAQYMPESRDKLPKVPRRYLIADPAPPLSPVHLVTLDKPVTRELFPHQEDGLAAQLIRLPPRTNWTGRDPVSGGGHFHFVIGGSIRYDGKEMNPYSCVHTAETEQALQFISGDKGAEVLMLQFPSAAKSA